MVGADDNLCLETAHPQNYFTFHKKQRKKKLIGSAHTHQKISLPCKHGHTSLRGHPKCASICSTTGLLFCFLCICLTLNKCLFCIISALTPPIFHEDPHFSILCQTEGKDPKRGAESFGDTPSTRVIPCWTPNYYFIIFHHPTFAPTRNY